MHLYSKNIAKFIKELKREAKQIIATEMGFKVDGDWFWDSKQQKAYRIRVVIFNDRNMLGYFDAAFGELGFHERLMRVSTEQLSNIVRHELAHFACWIEYGGAVEAHGAEFRALCRRMGWGAEVYAATMTVEEMTCAAVAEDSVLRKVQKLMSLAGSSNTHEAELAMIKSQQLLLKHNIDCRYIEDEERVCLKRILLQARIDAKMRAIGRILETFFVSIVYNRGHGITCLEVLGSVVNVEIAEYVAEILDRELDRLWQGVKTIAGLKGAVAKNSFFIGIAKGYCEKIEALQRGYDAEISRGLMVIEKKLVEAQKLAYGRLSRSRSAGGYCGHSAALGEQAGRVLNINPALNHRAKRSEALLTYSG